MPVAKALPVGNCESAKLRESAKVTLTRKREGGGAEGAGPVPGKMRTDLVTGLTRRETPGAGSNPILSTPSSLSVRLTLPCCPIDFAFSLIFALSQFPVGVVTNRRG